MLKSFFIWFTICLFCYLYRTICTVLKYQKYKFASKKYIITSVYIIMFILWFSWGQMCFHDPSKLALPAWSKYIGLIFSITGILLFIFSHGKLKGFQDKDHLVKNGIFTKIRNPMYLGFIIWIIGFPIFMQKLLSLLSSIIWIAHILVWKKIEEKELEAKYPDYLEYKKVTWF